MSGQDGREARRRAVLAIDTATTRVVVATGAADGTVGGVSTWAAGHRHGETLLPSIGRSLEEQGLRREDLAGIVVGTGPGAFTGLRVGMATAKGLAHGLRIPLVGVATGEVLLAAGAVERPVLLLPAGPSDRVLVRPGQPPTLLAGGQEPELAPDEVLLAVDLEGRAPDDAVARGEAARDGLGATLLRLGAERLTALEGSGLGELETVVPEYVTLPRGARTGDGTVEWSRDHR